MTTQSPSIALFGSGQEAQRWAWALAERAALVSGSLTGADGVVLAPEADRPLIRAQEALQAGLPVLWACGETAAALESLTRAVPQSLRDGRLRFCEPFQHPWAFNLIRRFLGGSEPFWRPLYLRIAASSLESGNKLDDRAYAALWAGQALLGPKAERVMAQAVQENGRQYSSLFVTVQYASGATAQYQVGRGECRNELVAITRDRRLVLDDQHLRIAFIGCDSVRRPSERVLALTKIDPVAEACRQFVASVSRRDCFGEGSELLGQVSRIWSAVRRSIDCDAPVWLARPVGERDTPPRKVFEGGGRVSRIHSRHKLSLVAS